MNVNRVIHMSDMGLRYGTGTLNDMNYIRICIDFLLIIVGHVAVIYILFQLWIDMPLMMLCSFLSSYCRKSYLTFWDCVPLFQGK